MRTILGTACAVMTWVAAAQAGEPWDVLDEGAVPFPPGEMMTRWLNAQAQQELAARREAFEQIMTPDACASHQEQLRRRFLETLGPWPERTPLNARVAGQEARDGYRIEKVVFESQPRFHVTATLYLPDAAPPYRAVLVPCGHAENAKAYESYQRACIMLAKHGLTAFIYDPIGQGERKQILDDDGRGAISSTIEHTLIGVGAILVGTNTAALRIWDGMRCLDYLETRNDIDGSGFGCAGNSGGGTLTSYLMALDPRIACAAPNCFLTSLERLLETAGPQDAEQNVAGAIAFGLNHADYAILRAPKPTLFCCVTRDFFDIEGTWDSFRQAKRFYTRLGHSERVGIVEDDSTHGFTQPLRVATTRWMRRWLLGVDDAVVEPDFPVAQDQALWCTPGGQVLLLDGERTAWDLLAEREAQLAGPRRAFWREASRKEKTARVRQASGIRPLADLPALEAAGRGVVKRDGFEVRTLTLTPEPGIVLPALAYVPEDCGGEARLYVDGRGKAAEAGENGVLEAWVRGGELVLAVDLRGMGETASKTNYKSWNPYFGTDWQDFYRAYLLGRSYVALRAEDVLVAARFLADYEAPGGAPNRVTVHAKGHAAIPALHAAALEPGLIAGVALEDPPPPWAETVRTPVTDNQLVNTLHGVLAAYDWPDLLSLASAE